MKTLAVALWISAAVFGQGGSAPTKTEQIFERASEALKTGDYAAAETGFQQILKAEPRNVSAMGNLGVVYSRTRRYARAIQVYRQALRISPKEKGILLDLGL